MTDSQGLTVRTMLAAEKERAALAPFVPNEEDWNGTYWDPWTAMGALSSYSSDLDEQALAVLRGIKDKLYCTDIAERAGLAPGHVELLQHMFCAAKWCDYGSSPRGCWFTHDHGDDFGDRLIAQWDAYYRRRWIDPRD